VFVAGISQGAYAKGCQRERRPNAVTVLVLLPQKNTHSTEHTRSTPTFTHNHTKRQTRTQKMKTMDAAEPSQLDQHRMLNARSV